MTNWFEAGSFATEEFREAATRDPQSDLQSLAAPVIEALNTGDAGNVQRAASAFMQQTAGHEQFSKEAAYVEILEAVKTDDKDFVCRPLPGRPGHVRERLERAVRDGQLSEARELLGIDTVSELRSLVRHILELV